MDYKFGDIIALMDNHEYSVIGSCSDQNMEYYLLLDNEDSSKQILIKKEKNNDAKDDNDEFIVIKDMDEIKDVLKKIANN